MSAQPVEKFMCWKFNGLKVDQSPPEMRWSWSYLLLVLCCRVSMSPVAWCPTSMSKTGCCPVGQPVSPLCGISEWEWEWKWVWWLWKGKPQTGCWDPSIEGRRKRITESPVAGHLIYARSFALTANAMRWPNKEAAKANMFQSPWVPAPIQSAPKSPVINQWPKHLSNIFEAGEGGVSLIMSCPKPTGSINSHPARRHSALNLFCNRLRDAEPQINLPHQSAAVSRNMSSIFMERDSRFARRLGLNGHNWLASGVGQFVVFCCVFLALFMRDQIRPPADW